MSGLMESGARIRRAREQAGIKQNELAASVGVQPNHLSRVERGDRKPSFDLVSKIAGALGIPVAELIGDSQKGLSPEDVITPIELSGEIVRLPVVAEVHAGKPQEVIEEEGDYIVIDRDFLPNGGEYFAVRVQGQSMMGVGITEGDLAIIRRQPVLEPGQIGVVDIEGEGACIKRVHFDGENVILSSANDKYAPRVLHSSRVRIVGILKLLHRQFVQ